MVATYPRVVVFTSPVSQVRAAAAKRQKRVKFRSTYTKHVRFYDVKFRAR